MSDSPRSGGWINMRVQSRASRLVRASATSSPRSDCDPPSTADAPYLGLLVDRVSTFFSASFLVVKITSVMLRSGYDDYGRGAYVVGASASRGSSKWVHPVR